MITQLEEIMKLPTAERLLLAEALWDSLEDETNSSWKMSDSWKKEIERRYQLYKEGKTELFTWEEAKEQLHKLK